MIETTWTETARKFIEDIRECEDADDRFDLIMELGETVPPMPDELKVEANRVQGCTSNVWLVPELLPGDPPTIRFMADSDSTMVRGLAALLIWHANDRPCTEVASFDFNQLADEFALRSFLSPSRSNGLYAMSKRLGRIATACMETRG